MANVKIVKRKQELKAVAPINGIFQFGGNLRSITVAQAANVLDSIVTIAISCE
jgi:hypothetical protein